MKKNRILWLLSAVVLLAAVSCRQEEPQSVEWKTELQAVRSDLSFTPEGGSGTLEVNLSSVSAASNRDWCSVSTSGNIISVTVTPNRGNQSRYARVTVTSGSESIGVAVIQYGEVFAGLELADQTVPKEGTVLQYSFTSNVPVNLSSDQPWVHFEMDSENKVVTVIVDENGGFGTRFATVSYEAGSNSRAMQITQAPTFAPVEGWTLADTDGYFDFPDQIDFITVTPPAGDKYYLFEVFSPDVMPAGEAGTWIAEAANEASASILALLATGDIQSVGDILLKGTQSEQFENLPSTSKGLVICFDDKGYPTGEYVLTDVAVPDRGPVKQLVEGWDIVHSDARYVYPTQTDVITVTPKAGYENAKYIATVVSKDAVSSVEDFAFTTFAMNTRDEILAKVESGELSSFDAGLSVGETTLSVENMAGDVYVVVVEFGNNKFYTGNYTVAEMTLDDIMPAFYKWIGKWNVSRKNDKYDDIDTWEITIKDDEKKILNIHGIEGFDNPDRYDAEATVDETTGELILKSQNCGQYEDSTRGTVTVLLSGRYTNVQNKTYYTSSLNVVLFRAAMSEDGLSADLNPGSVTSAGSPATFFDIQFYGRYVTASGSTSAITWNAGPTQIPQTITRVTE